MMTHNKNMADILNNKNIYSSKSNSIDLQNGYKYCVVNQLNILTYKYKAFTIILIMTLWYGMTNFKHLLLVVTMFP